MNDDALILAERTVLGIVMRNPDKAADVFAHLRVEDFTGPHMLIAEAIHGLRLNRKPIDPLLVSDEMTRRGTLNRVGGRAYVSEFDVALSPETLAYYVEIITRRVRLRRLDAIGARATQLVHTSDADPDAIARAVVEQAQAIVDGIEADGEVNTPTLAEFLDGEDAPHDWVLPGLLERADRLILTGSEGLGKSVLFRQLAVCAAAGVHPFTGQPIPAQRVLYVDVENSTTQLRRALRDLAGKARHRSTDAESNLMVECRPEGLDLTKPEDEAWLVRRVAALQPALLLTGPLYRLHNENPNDEKPARTVAKVLDRCRAAANCALVLEAHAGHATGVNGERNVRPTGTSLWLRWPEFGYGIRPAKDFNPATRVVDVVAWRGDRSERAWPKRLKAGSYWPWEQAAVEQQWGAA